MELNNAKILDLFSGTGSFGIECLSRGAKSVTFFENYSNSIKILKKNLDLLDLNKNSTIIEKDVFSINPAQHNLSKFNLIISVIVLKGSGLMPFVQETTCIVGSIYGLIL